MDDFPNINEDMVVDQTGSHQLMENRPENEAEGDGKHSVPHGINLPQKHYSPLTCQASPTPLNLQTVQALLFRQLPPPYQFFVNSPY